MTHNSRFNRYVDEDLMSAVRCHLLPISLMALSLFVGCDFPLGSDRVCTLESVAGIRLATVDSTTGAAADTTGMRAFAQQGQFIEELFGPPFDEEFRGLYERPGRYVLTVVSPLYEPWGRADVRVRAGDCHVEPVGITAQLVPIPDP